MIDLFRGIYSNLPVVRELYKIHEELKQLKCIENIRLKAELDAQTARLLQDPRYAAPRSLSRYASQAFSQSGEDGIISEIFRRIGTHSRTFLEIGIGNGLENDTVALLAYQQWRGHWVDGNSANVELIRRHFAKPVADGRLQVEQSFVTAANVVDLLQRLGVPEEPDLFSLDIDRNTYSVWEALPQLRPRVAVVEYNATVPPEIDWKVNYVSDRGWNGTSYFGASLKAFELLGRRLGYNLVGCTLNGVNAFFVREDLCGGNFEQPYSAEHHYEPPRYYLTYRTSHPSTFTDDSPAPSAPWSPGV